MVESDHLVGLLMVDRPEPADPAWLEQISEVYGECELVPMTQNGDRGLLCRMQIDEESLPHLRQDISGQSVDIQQALAPLLVAPPAPKLRLSWDEEASLWRSELDMENVLPTEIRELFERTWVMVVWHWRPIRISFMFATPQISIFRFSRQAHHLPLGADKNADSAPHQAGIRHP